MTFEHVAVGYRWGAIAAANHLDRSLRSLVRDVTYVGPAYRTQTGWDATAPVVDLLAHLSIPPDLYLWIDSAGQYFPNGIEDLNIPTACYLIDVHLGTWREQVARFFDAVFVAQKDYVSKYRQVLGHDQVYWLPLAAASDVHYQHDLQRVYDVGFVGNLAKAHQGTARARRLRLISERFSTNDFYRPYTPEEVGRVYSQSRIVFNTSIAGDVTMRVFEGAASGALVLTDSATNGLAELFVPNREIVTYDDDEDLLAKIAYYLEYDKERHQIAQAGRRRVIAEHTYQQRAKSILDIVAEPKLKRLAPMRSGSPATRFRARREGLIHLHMVEALIDEAKSAGYGPLRRMWAVLPALFRRVLR